MDDKGSTNFFNKKKQLYKLKINKPTDGNIAKYKKYVSLYNKLLRLRKSNYYEDIFEEHKNNIKETWKTLKKVIQKSSNKLSVPNEIIIDGEAISDENAIVDSFNKYFVTIGTNTNNTIPRANTTFSDYLEYQNINTIFF